MLIYTKRIVPSSPMSRPVFARLLRTFIYPHIYPSFSNLRSLPFNALDLLKLAPTAQCCPSSIFCPSVIVSPNRVSRLVICHPLICLLAVTILQYQDCVNCEPVETALCLRHHMIVPDHSSKSGSQESPLSPSHMGIYLSNLFYSSDACSLRNLIQFAYLRF